MWRAFSPSYYVEAGQAADSEARAAELALVEAHMARDAQRTRDWLRRAPEESPEWYAVGSFSDSVLLLTAEELGALNEAVQGLLAPYRRWQRSDPPAEARTVAVQWRSVPID